MTKDKKVITYPDSIDTRVALLEMSIININETMKEIRSELKEIRSDIKDVRTEMHSGFNDLRKEMKSDFRWMLTIVIGLYGSLGGIMAHGFHWF